MEGGNADLVPISAHKTDDNISTLCLTSKAGRSDECTSKGAPSEQMSSEPVPGHLYQSLVGSSSMPILFAWWPTAKAWCYDELVEQCTRCLPGVRPNMDVVALPRLKEVEELWAVWARQHAMGAWQVVWFTPFPVGDGAGLEETPTPPEAALDEVVADLPARASLGHFVFYPMSVTSEMARASERLGLRVVGDAADHPICPLSSAKDWLHPHINPQRRGPSLRDALPAREGDEPAARGPSGYIASSSEELVEAMRTLRTALPSGARLVLKPSWASGGDSIVMDVTEAQLADFAFPPGGRHTAILEELIEGSGESPTLYMIGGEPCGQLVDQILSREGIVNDGKLWPSPTATERLTQACIAAAQEIQNVWGLRSQWGLDFVINHDEVPIVVDLNMGRPNGNFSVRLWESRFRQCLYLHMSSWVPPAGITAELFFGVLRERGLAWNPSALQGVLVYQHFPGKSSAYVVASADSWKTVGTILGRLKGLIACVS